MEDFISGLQTMSTGRVDLNSLINGVDKSLQLIEPWCKASADHPILVNVIQDIQKHGLVYCEAIDISIQTAQDGYSFSRDAIDLCDFLLKPDITREDLLEYISEMLDTAKRAREDSTKTMEKFRLVRTGLMEITKRIPTEVDQLTKEDGGKRKNLHFRIPFFSRKCGFATRKTKRAVGIEVAIAELRRAATDLVKLSESVHAFAAWWARMELVLSTVETRADSLKHRTGQKLTIESMRGGWCQINEDYREYKIRTIQLQDSYPSASRNAANLRAGRAGVEGEVVSVDVDLLRRIR